MLLLLMVSVLLILVVIYICKMNVLGFDFWYYKLGIFGIIVVESFKVFMTMLVSSSRCKFYIIFVF